jgi:hypothetical protein
MNSYLLIIFIILLILIFLYKIQKENYNLFNYSTPVVSAFQDYHWYTPSNPNLGFAPAVHFVSPSRRECLNFIRTHYSDPNEQFTKFIECLQNVSSKVRIKNLPIQSPGIGEEYRYL